MFKNKNSALFVFCRSASIRAPGPAIVTWPRSVSPPLPQILPICRTHHQKYKNMENLRKIMGDLYDIDYSLSDGFVFTLCVLDSTVEDFIQWNMEMMLQRSLYQNQPTSIDSISTSFLYHTYFSILLSIFIYPHIPSLYPLYLYHIISSTLSNM